MSPYLVLDLGLRLGGRRDAGLLRLDVEPDYSDLVLVGHRLVKQDGTDGHNVLHQGADSFFLGV